MGIGDTVVKDVDEEVCVNAISKQNDIVGQIDKPHCQNEVLFPPAASALDTV